MKANIKSTLLKRLSNCTKSFISELIGPLYRHSYSQFGEDMILRAIFSRFPDTYKGLYIEIGAHHPRRFSNSKYFYDQGWSGCCVDPLPECEKAFIHERPRDKFINMGIGDAPARLTYYMYKEAAFNTFSEPVNRDEVLHSKEVEVITLQQLFNVNKIEHVDFLGIDAEGYDEKILMSYDWITVRPLVIFYEETKTHKLSEINQTQVSLYLESKGYCPLIRTPSAVFYFNTKAPNFNGSSYLDSI